jgi:hypothetical protein
MSIQVLISRLGTSPTLTTPLQSGIYTGPDPIADKVIEIHDPLFDSRVMFIAESALLNEAG